MTEQEWDEGWEDAEELAAEAATSALEETVEEVAEETAEELEEETFDVKFDLTPPPLRKRRKYPFDTMRIGGYFEVPVSAAEIAEYGPERASRMVRSRVSSAASTFNKTHDDRRMVVRKVHDTLFRCWCMAPID